MDFSQLRTARALYIWPVVVWEALRPLVWMVSVFVLTVDTKYLTRRASRAPTSSVRSAAVRWLGLRVMTLLDACCRYDQRR